MSDLRHHLRFSVVALAAIVGMLLAGGDASASTAKAAPKNGAPACCIAQGSTVCCCEPAEASSCVEPAGRLVSRPLNEARLSTAARSCECRSRQSQPPASRSETRSPEGRTDRIDDAVGALTINHARPPITVVRRIFATASPPRSPLYIQNARLLI